MLKIITDGFNSPDDTYFNTKAAQPELERDEQGEQVLNLVNGQGTRRSSWGAPGVTSTIVLHTDDLVAIHVGYYHKHGGGQFWRYYRNDGSQWQEVSWPKLSDEDRQRVLDAYEDRAPSYAKVPGKLRTSYAKPTGKTYTTYKLVEVVDGKYYGVYDGKTEYVLGKRMAEKAVEDHGGGYYSYPSAEGVEATFHAGTLFPRRCYEDAMTLALIECEISGTIINYDGRKYASTYIKPVKEIKRFNYTPAKKEAC
jgi:hypothetical protein